MVQHRQPYQPGGRVAPQTPARRRTASGRPVAAGGWRRAVIGVVVGAVTGALALALRRAPEDR